MKVCIVGGGNIGTALAGDLSSRWPLMEVRMLTSNPGRFSKTISVRDVEDGTVRRGSLDLVSDDFSSALSDADWIFVTVPSFLFRETFGNMAGFLKPGASVCVVPGSGGAEHHWCRHFNELHTLIGMERVPFISRLTEYGQSVDILSRKKHITASALYLDRTASACETLQDLLRVPCREGGSYLNIALTPSNPLLHTARLYDLFSGSSIDDLHEFRPLFYSDWTNQASSVLLEMDDELQELCRELDELNLSGVTSLREHYESPTPEALTEKMRGVPSFRGIAAPMLPSNGGYAVDVRSRYFQEDFNYGLVLIRGIMDVVGTSSPSIDRVLTWYEGFFGKEIFTAEGFSGDYLKSLPIARNCGLDRRETIVEFYSQTSP